MIIKLSKIHLQKAKDFAHERLVSSNLYKSRGSFKYTDLIVGVLGEFGSVKHLRNQGWSVPDPDLKIYSKEDKSYEADLKGYKEDENKSFHVKSQSIQQQGKPWANSWLLQKTDPLVNSNNYKHILICCIVDIENLKVEILGSVN